MSTIERQAALDRRIKSGGNRVLWSARDLVMIRDYVMSAPATAFIAKRAPTATAANAYEIALVKVQDAPHMKALTDRQAIFTVSTEAVDRMNDTVAAAGLDLSHYRKNPTVLYGHDSSALPIGNSVDIWRSGNGIKAICQFADDPDAERVRNLVQTRVLKGASIGFIPKKWRFSTAPGRQLGIDFEEAELLEWSVCAVPANAFCLLASAGAGGAKAARRTAGEAGEEPEWRCGAARDLPIDETDTPWDAPAAMERIFSWAGFKGDSPKGEKAARAFLIFDAANSTERSSFKLPFADVRGGALVAVKAGIRAAASRLNQTTVPQVVLDHAKAVIDHYEGRFDSKAARVQHRRAMIARDREIVELRAKGNEMMLMTPAQRRAAEIAEIKARSR